MKNLGGRPRKGTLEEKKAIVDHYFVTMCAENASVLQKRGIYKNLADFAQERGYDYAAYHFSRDPVICAYISSLTEAAEKALPLDILPVFVPLDLSLIIERSREEIVEMLRDRDKYYEKLYASANATLQPFQAKVRAYEEAQAELTVQLSKNGQLTEEKNALDLNKGHSLSEYFSQSNEYAMWRCKEGHEWEARIDHRTAGQGCPYCEGKKVIPEETSFAAKHPKMAKRWHPTQNNGRQPYEFTEFSHFEAIWICPKGHEYPMPIYRKSRGCGCSVCAGKHVLAGYNDIESQAPHLALEWDDEHNEGIKSCEVALHSNERYNWKCTVCGHQWKTSPNNRAKGTGCPACKHCCVDPLVNSLAVVNPNLAKQWDNERNSPLTSLDVAGYDNRDYYWVCEKGHSWKASPANRNKGTGCPYCKRKKPIVGKTDLASQAPALSKMLHPTKNGKRTAVDYFVDYTRDIWWLCESGHSFRASPRSMVAGWRCKVCDPW